MNATKNKLLNAAINRYMNVNGEHVEQLVQRQLNRPNRHGYRQHRRVNPKRQLKKLILRYNIV